MYSCARTIHCVIIASLFSRSLCSIISATATATTLSGSCITCVWVTTSITSRKLSFKRKQSNLTYGCHWCSHCCFKKVKMKVGFHVWRRWTSAGNSPQKPACAACSKRIASCYRECVWLNAWINTIWMAELSVCHWNAIGSVGSVPWPSECSGCSLLSTSPGETKWWIRTQYD